jgi:hypothetical protein
MGTNDQLRYAGMVSAEWICNQCKPFKNIPEYFNYWTPENPSNDFPAMNYLSTSSTIAGFSGLTYIDGSFFKIKNITLGYTLPASTTKRIQLTDCVFTAR